MFLFSFNRAYSLYLLPCSNLCYCSMDIKWKKKWKKWMIFYGTKIYNLLINLFSFNFLFFYLSSGPLWFCCVQREWFHSYNFFFFERIWYVIHCISEQTWYWILYMWADPKLSIIFNWSKMIMIFVIDRIVL